MPKYPEITIRDCGAVGFLGLAFVNDKEIYRTGKHYPSAHDCFYALYDWIQNNTEEVCR